MSESDGIDEPLEQVLQHGMAISAQIGREVSRIWQARMEEKGRLTERERRNLQLAFDTEQRTARSLLKPTQDSRWWDQAKPGDVMDAYRVASAWKDHDPEALRAEEVIRTEAANRYGIDAAKLAQEQDRFGTSPVLQMTPEQLAQAHQWAQETGWKSDIPSYYSETMRLRNMVDDCERSKKAWESSQANDKPTRKSLGGPELTLLPAANAAITRPTAQDYMAALEWAGENAGPAYVEWGEKYATAASSTERAALESELVKQWHRQTEAQTAEARAGQDRAEGDQLTTEAKSQYSQADRAQESAVTAEHDGPSEAEEAWYRDTFLTDSPESQEAQSKAADAKETAERRENAGDRATVRAGVAYDSAERQEALASRMRAAGAPEKGIQARTFAESQQKHPIGHAAAGQGKTVNKVKTNSPQKAQTQGKQRSR